MVPITSTELNYLVFRYLHESGFTHSAFSFGNEAGISKITIDGNMVPPAALVTFVQKGIQYLELEANIGSNDADIDEDFSFLQPLDLITKDASELQKIVKEKKESLHKTRRREKENGNDVSQSEFDREHAREREKKHVREREREREHVREREKERERDHAREREKEHDREREKEKQQREKEKEREREKIEKERERELGKDNEKPHADLADTRHDGDNMKLEHEENGAGSEPMDVETVDISLNSSAIPCIIPDSDVTILEGHASEVFVCAWSPSGPLLASGAGDSTARIWTISEEHSSSKMQGIAHNSAVLKHSRGRTQSKDVTTLDWNGEGTLLATGSYDGQARIWSREGELVNTLIKHKGPIFSLKWNKKGDYLLSGSVDKTAIVWNIKTGEWIQQFEFHSAPTLDVDWRNDVSFATCSTDSMIYVCKVGEDRPIKTFSGHQGEVNAVKWDPTGQLLASCSDDSTAKIWSMKQDTCVHDLREHNKEIYAIKWSPTGPGTNCPNQKLLLASASFDSTVKLWDVDSGSLLYSLNGHRDPVYTVAFSPNGEYIASGSLDKCVHVWSVKDARIVKTYTGNGGIFEVCWNNEGDKIAACFANNVVCVLDFRM